MPHEPIRFSVASDASAEALASALAALERGQLVAVPTETLYTLVARADREPARAQLSNFAGEAPARLVASVAALPGPSPLVKRLAARYWPGPLILALQDERWRSPAHAVAARLVESAPFPLVGLESSLDVPQLLERGGGELACVLDAGPARLGEPAAVLELRDGHMRLLRPGLFDLETLRATAGLRIGFVCTGNTCRSPMAEGLARKLLAERLGVAPTNLAEFGFSVQSMGVHASPGDAASAHAIATLAARGIDLHGHQAQVALPDVVTRLDRVYTLTRSHLQALRQSLPPGKDRHCTLLDPDGRDISDPIGGPRAAYEQTAAQIERALLARLDDWA